MIGWRKIKPTVLNSNQIITKTATKTAINNGAVLVEFAAKSVNILDLLLKKIISRYKCLYTIRDTISKAKHSLTQSDFNGNFLMICMK